MWRRRSWFSLKGKAGIPGQERSRPATSARPRAPPAGSVQQRGPRSYLQIVENRRDGRAVRQHVIATLGRIDELAARGGLATLLASGARFCIWVMSGRPLGGLTAKWM